MSIYSKADTPNTYRWLGMCNRVRAMSEKNNQKWHDMIGQAENIDQEMFVRLANDDDLISVFDLETEIDDPTVIGAIDDAIETVLSEMHREDPTMRYFLSLWGTLPAIAIQQSGFEWIFVLQE